MKSGRKFNWVSSADRSNNEQLNLLNLRMTEYYSGIKSRKTYQEMIDANNSDFFNPDTSIQSFIDYLKSLPISSIIEVGCGNGRIYPFIQDSFKKCSYTGFEVSKEVINENKRNYPSASWFVANAYNIPYMNESIDVCFSFYVLEHLVFPEKAICEMLRVIKKGGYLILIFPDFTSTGRFPSQKIGFSDIDTARNKLKKGRLIDAIVSLYDSRIRLPRSLKEARKKTGAFPVNINPKCLWINDSQIGPDVDAIYISSKNEIEDWAINKGYKISFPAGKENYFSHHTFMSIQK